MRCSAPDCSRAQTGARLYIVHTSSRRGPHGRAACPRCRHRHHHRDLPALSHPRHRVGGRRHWQDQSAAARAGDREALWNGLARRRHRHRRDRSRASRHLRQGGRHLEGVARMPGARDAAAGDADRRASRARHSARADRRTAGERPGRRHGPRPQGPHRGRARRGPRDRRSRPRIRVRPRGRALQRRLFDLRRADVQGTSGTYAWCAASSWCATAHWSRMWLEAAATSGGNCRVRQAKSTCRRPPSGSCRW